MPPPSAASLQRGLLQLVWDDGAILQNAPALRAQAMKKAPLELCELPLWEKQLRMPPLRDFADPVTRTRW